MRERPASRLSKLAEVTECEVLASTPTTPKIQVSPSRVAPRVDVNISTSNFSPLRPSPPLVSKYRGPPTVPSPNRKAKQSTAPSELVHADNPVPDLERLAEWAKQVELYVEQARRAMAEGRPVPSMTLPDLEELKGHHAQSTAQATRPESPPFPRKSDRLGPRDRKRSEVTGEAEVPAMTVSSRRTASTALQTPATARTSLPKVKGKGKEKEAEKEKDTETENEKEKEKGSLSKAASQTLKRHPVSQVFRRWGDRHDKGATPEQPRIAVRKSEPQLERRPVSSQLQEVLGEEEPERVTPSRLGKAASSRSLREVVQVGLGRDRSKTVPRRFGASPYAERETQESSKKEDKKERRISLFKLFKGKK
ncbi:hypothetical protein CC85DRAFT_43538 [Cutaneotrichosporon oleaginosum]|uniref:Uncharacterized protein n=1 Tax=Cutaneotrichosporon oleaginosum TaxID=879819 RepID=A0A0J0XRR2_9TREE|nr:uncharacterized protein CC85DRAFT_43538 [Cutaneotrichosporon oleaginosum]KLT43777.1 hypothetical protein CC85DRAFT_43538 [Cutaneotrichosporon oleaginosum]TXT05192.1 hypothetical protein COLE_06512 [Cutaneotrichosporon oleaginosum]